MELDCTPEFILQKYTPLAMSLPLPFRPSHTREYSPASTCASFRSILISLPATSYTEILTGPDCARAYLTVVVPLNGFGAANYNDVPIEAILWSKDSWIDAEPVS